MRITRSGGSARSPFVLATISVLVTAFTLQSWAQFPGRRQGPRFTPDTSHTADALLRNAAAHVRDKQWPEAIDIYQKVISQFADKVAELSKDDRAGDPSGDMPLSIDLRLYCQRKIAALPPEALAVYRARVDSQAERWFREGESSRDRTLLRRVVDQAYCSSWGDNAIERLGDFAFQDGRFVEALAYYRMLVDDGTQPDLGRIYPDPDVNLAVIGAKALLSKAAAGLSYALDSDIKNYSVAFPDAVGDLAGRKGSLADIVKLAIEEDKLVPSSKLDARWPTFAGGPTRSRIAPGPIDIGSFQWQVKLKSAYSARQNPYGNGMNGFNPRFQQTNLPKPSEERLLAYHPIVVGDQVIVASDDRVLAYNLNDRPISTLNSVADTVPEAWKHEDPNSYPPVASRGNVAIPRFTLTALGDRIYARMGQTGGSSSPRLPSSQSMLVEIDRGTGKLLQRRSAMEIQLPRKGAEANRRPVFEGTPVADENNVYVGVTETEALTQMYVACLSADKLTPRWVRYLGAGTSVDAGLIMGGGGGMGGMAGVFSTEVGTRLLTLAGPSLYYQTNMGALASLDAETGSIRWVATYPRIERNNPGASPQRDLNPALVSDGLVIIAPDDANAIFAFDAGSGKLAWKSDPIPEDMKLNHVLGVAHGKLIATGDRVYWFDAKTGKLEKAWPDGGRPFEGFGRGLLAGDRVYWPTKTEIHILDQATGLRNEPPIKLQEAFGTSGGNLVAGDGYLVVAQGESMVVFCQNSRLIQRYREEIARAPEEPVNYYRLARAAEATGHDELALATLDETARRAKPSDLLDGVSLLDSTRDHQTRLLTKLAKQDIEKKDFKSAIARFTRASEVARLSKDRLAARLELADTLVANNDLKAAVDCLQGLLAEEPLRGIAVPALDHQRTVRADLLIAGRLDQLVKSKGSGFYAQYDAEAAALLKRAVREESPRLLEEVSRGYPVAKAVPEAWFALAELQLRRKQPSEAARAYKRLLSTANTEQDRAKALLGMAEAYELQRHWVLARENYSLLAARFSGVKLGGKDVSSLAKTKLEAPPFDRLSGTRDDLTLRLPLQRAWTLRWSGTTRVMAAMGVPPATDAGRMFMVQGGSIRPVNPMTGQVGWTADLGGEPLWIGYIGDRVVAATGNRIVGLNLTQGGVDWEYLIAEPAAPGVAAGLNPFAKTNQMAGVGAPNEADVGLGPKLNLLHGFKLVGERLICLKGETGILSIDGELGQVEWSYGFNDASINPLIAIGERRIVLQALGDKSRTMVLETETGHKLGSFATPDAVPWLREPVLLDDERVVLVTDRRTVVALDMSKGTEAWSFREAEELPKYGPPRLISDGQRLVVLHDGLTFVRLDVKTGERLWRTPHGFKDLSERPDSVAIDGSRIYCTTDDQWAGQVVKAFDIDRGGFVWEHPLAGPSTTWAISVTESSLLAYPSVRTQLDPTEGLPVSLINRADGGMVQRFLFSAGSAPLEMSLTAHGVMVATDHGLWALSERRAMDSAPSPR